MSRETEKEERHLVQTEKKEAEKQRKQSVERKDRESERQCERKSYSGNDVVAMEMLSSVRLLHRCLLGIFKGPQ